MAHHKEEEQEEVEEAEESAPRWILTYADMITLLCTFFILLVSIGATDAKKYKEAQASIRDTFGAHSNKYEALGQGGGKGGGGIGGIGELSSLMGMGMSKREANETLFFQAIKKFVEKDNKLSSSSEMEMEKDGIRLRIKGQSIFTAGSAELSPDADALLDKVKELMDKYEYTLIVEGHTDNVPIKSEIYPSNWELSSARAISVIRYFMEKLKVPPGRLQAVGYADTKPLVDNSTPENRAKNRRVELKFEQPVLKKYREAVAQPKASFQLDVFEKIENKKRVLKQFQESPLEKAKDL